MGGEGEGKGGSLWKPKKPTSDVVRVLAQSVTKADDWRQRLFRWLVV
jgi:hypothetical protein